MVSKNWRTNKKSKVRFPLPLRDSSHVRTVRAVTKHPAVTMPAESDTPHASDVSQIVPAAPQIVKVDQSLQLQPKKLGVAGEKLALPVGSRRGESGYYVESRLRDGRKQVYIVNAYSRDDAIRVVESEYPESVITKVVPKWRYKLIQRELGSIIGIGASEVKKIATENGSVETRGKAVTTESDVTEQVPKKTVRQKIRENLESRGRGLDETSDSTVLDDPDAEDVFPEEKETNEEVLPDEKESNETVFGSVSRKSARRLKPNQVFPDEGFGLADEDTKKAKKEKFMEESLLDDDDSDIGSVI